MALLSSIPVLLLFVMLTIRAETGVEETPQPQQQPQGRRVLPTRGIRTQKPQTPPQRVLDPQLSWLMFVRHSDRNSNRHRTRSGLRNKNVLPAPVGPPGLPGPPGPPGPPGANVTKEVLISEFRSMVREAAEKRIQKKIDPECLEECKPTALETVEDELKSAGPYVPPLFNVDRVHIIPRVSAGFMCRLSSTITVPKQALIEVKNFYVPFGDGAFQRGDGFSPNALGKFTIPKSGIYHFSLNFLIWQKREKTEMVPKDSLVSADEKKPKDVIRVAICIDALCQKNAALESITSLSNPGQRVTLSINGFLEMKKGQKVSVFVDNDSNFALRVHSDSHFSAIYVGI